MRRKFAKHRFAVGSAVVLVLLYGAAAFAGFVAPYDRLDSRTEFALAPPTRVRVFHDGRLQRPFVYGLTRERDPVTLLMVYTDDETQRHPVRLLVTGDEYKLIGLFPSNQHLFGVEAPSVMYLFGADQLGRDVLSRVVHGARISLSIGLLGVAVSFVFGCLLGGLSGLLGGPVEHGDSAGHRVLAVAAHHPAVDGVECLRSARLAPVAQILHDHGDPVDHRLARAGAGGAGQDPAASRGGLRNRRRCQRGDPHQRDRASHAAQLSGLPDRAPHAGGARHDPRRDRAQPSWASACRPRW